ncbi:hypothetical protein G6038_06265 [Rhodococcus sp. 14C212]|uniref:hypothetical protein n=1 Tax=Rhodococcus sp. 14C212 TaxID=2711209 RepID=UPI0013EBDB11|nr:hypothetical protein [Rhodococcus sp. 14C212]NGP05096.1 hypothetical protein [Rhodococcus sp. 14C212]
MKLRLGATGAVPKDLPVDLTGHAITIDLSHVGTEQAAAAADLIRELLDRGAARLVISDARDAAPRTVTRPATGHPHAA